MLGIFERIWAPAFPTVHPRAHLLLRVRGRRTEIGTHTVQIRFRDPQGAVLAAQDGTVAFGEPPAGVTTLEAGVVLCFDLPLPAPGSYALEIELDGQPAARIPLEAAPVPATDPA